MAQNQHLEQIIEEVCCRILELEIAIDLAVGMWIHQLASGFCEAKEEATRIPLELKMQNFELRLKAQPSTPQEVRDQHASNIRKGLEEIEYAVQSYTMLLEESFRVLTTLQEDPTIQWLETEARELQMQYDSVHETS